MPPPDDATRLRHILDSACKAVQVTRGKTRDDLDRDELLALALTRLLEIIGEASTGITEGCSPGKEGGQRCYRKRTLERASLF